ncbi:hypothetical protein KAT36_00165 [Candidatus Pacearchaeota archaeon]|nr:hypothetical protein [Candidatus Pacearchaeota archaeon]
MKLQNLLQELQETSHYEAFQKQNPDSFFAAAFLILDTENKIPQNPEDIPSDQKQIQLDFFIPSQNKIASFPHLSSEPKIHDDKIENMQLQTLKIKIDINDIEPTCKQIIKENNSAISPTKIIAILRDNQWNLTCMDNALGIIRIKIDAISGETLDYNKGSLMDFMGIKKTNS